LVGLEATHDHWVAGQKGAGDHLHHVVGIRALPLQGDSPLHLVALLSPHESLDACATLRHLHLGDLLHCANEPILVPLAAFELRC